MFVFAGYDTNNSNLFQSIPFLVPRTTPVSTPNTDVP